MERAWIYCRTAQEDSCALEWQKRQLEEYAKRHGMEVAGITAVCEGGLTLRRPGIEEVGRAAEKGMADILLVKSTGRLGRGALQAAGFIGWLEQRGIRVVCIDEPADRIPVYHFGRRE